MHDFAPYFAAGMMLFLIYRDGHSWLSWGLVAWNWCLAVPLAVADVSARNHLTDRTGSVPVTLVLLALAFLAWPPAARGGPSGSSGVALLAGALTYPLYLIHEYWGFYIINRTQSSSASTAPSPRLSW